MKDPDLSLKPRRTALEVENEESEIAEFDDMRAGIYKDLTAIRVMHGAVIDAVQFVYGNRETKLYGGPGGTLSEFKLQSGEHITKLYIVKGAYANYPKRVVCYITFYTDKNRSFSCGSQHSCRNTRSYYDEPPEGNYIRSFHGSYGRYLTSISFYYRKNGLTKFNDLFFAQDKIRVSEIRVAAGWVVDSIQLIYDGNKPAQKHGGNGGTLKTLKLQKGEYITSISGKFGNYTYRGPDTLCSVTITTNLNNSISGGSEEECSDLEPFNYEAGPNRQIFAIEGNYSSYMGKLYVGMYALINELPYSGGGKTAAAVSDDLSGGSLTDAVNGMYFSDKEFERMIGNTLKVTEKDGVVEKAINKWTNQLKSTNVTKLYVNTPQIVFRASEITPEVDHILKNMSLISKAQRWKKHNEPIINEATQNTTQADYSTVLRTVAIKTSYAPPSQFVSIALDLDCASAFMGSSDVVYAFEIVPNSPMLGLKKPKEVGKGEDQFQILGGTSIRKLFRYTDPTDKWEEYRYNSASKTGTWFETSDRPYNKEYTDLMNAVSDEDAGRIDL